MKAYIDKEKVRDGVKFIGCEPGNSGQQVAQTEMCAGKVLRICFFKEYWEDQKFFNHTVVPKLYTKVMH